MYVKKICFIVVTTGLYVAENQQGVCFFFDPIVRKRKKNKIHEGKPEEKDRWSGREQSRTSLEKLGERHIHLTAKWDKELQLVKRVVVLERDVTLS
ncbi:hypothetical protein TNIN_43061 [Trichonephila inaurata madagascariensis]|uniref:Uncharacterized protein n=1 Tax=Trichonephila inaurata madagascariensis TaxID=2747483 RepID=A0A8X7BY20_9ARAC|nr:hypothetical protein TNIN_43061 [Trichonephila inaurata madagascariensis]